MGGPTAGNSATGGGYNKAGTTGNAYGDSALALNNAYANTEGALQANLMNFQQGNTTGYLPSLMSPASYDPATMKAAGYAPGMYNAKTFQADPSYDPAQMTASGYKGAGYSAATSADPSKIISGIPTYMNPYTNEVISNAQKDINRQREIELNQIGGDAANAGAFAGGRHGLVEAEANRSANDAFARTTADLRKSGWDTAAALSGQDIATQQQNDQFNATQRNQARAFTSDAMNRANEFTANAENYAKAGNMEAANQAKAQAAQYKQQAMSQNAQSINQARQFSTQAKDNASRYRAEAENMARAGNMEAANKARALATQYEQEASRYNAQAENDSKQFNADFGADAFQQFFQNQMGGANQLANLGQQGFDTARTITGDQNQQGTQAQQLVQAILSAGSGMVDQYLSSPENILNLRLGAVGMTPGANKGTSTSTTSYDPGVAGTLSAITSVLGAGKGDGK